MKRLASEEEGQAIVEYGLLAAAIIVCLTLAGGGIKEVQKAVYTNQHHALRDWRAP